MQADLFETDLSKATILASYPVIISAALVFALNTVRRTIRIEHVQVRTPRLQDPDLFARRFREVLHVIVRRPGSFEDVPGMLLLFAHHSAAVG